MQDNMKTDIRQKYRQVLNKDSTKGCKLQYQNSFVC